jgi:hypothetical protein
MSDRRPGFSDYIFYLGGNFARPLSPGSVAYGCVGLAGAPITTQPTGRRGDTGQGPHNHSSSLARALQTQFSLTIGYHDDPVPSWPLRLGPGG